MPVNKMAEAKLYNRKLAQRRNRSLYIERPKRTSSPPADQLSNSPLARISHEPKGVIIING